MTLLAAATFPVTNPATLEVIEDVVDRTPEDAVAAVDAAAAAFPAWSQMTHGNAPRRCVAPST